jgi:hypothetical protein
VKNSGVLVSFCGDRISVLSFFWGGDILQFLSVTDFFVLLQGHISADFGVFETV